MKKPQTVVQDEWVFSIIAEETAPYDRHAYLRPWRYFRFYMLFEPKSRRTCWLPEGYDV